MILKNLTKEDEKKIKIFLKENKIKYKELDEVLEKIFKRNEHFFISGIIEEYKKVEQKYGPNSEAMTANAYPLIRKFLNGELDEKELIDKMSVQDWRLAKRQITFMKRNKDIVWLNLKDAEQLKELLKFVDDKNVYEKLAQIKHKNKIKLKKYLQYDKIIWRN